jgi:ABC-type phosphate/phosphonate transport system substrate-binding protein
VKQQIYLWDGIMHRIFKYGLLAILAMSAWPAFADDASPDKPLEIGVVPYLSARVLIASYEPMRLYLEQVLGKPVKIYTAA